MVTKQEQEYRDKEENAEEEEDVDEQQEIYEETELNQKAILKSPDFLKKFAELYNKHQDFKVVRVELNKEYNHRFDYQTLVNLYNKNVSKEMLTNPENSKYFYLSTKKMKGRMEDAFEMTDWLVSQVKEFRLELDKQEKNSRVLTAIKLIPTLTNLSKSILDQISIVQKQIEKIEVNQQTLIYSPIQMNLEIKKYHNSWVENMVEKGYIKIIKDIPGLNRSKEKPMKGGEK